MKANVGQLDSRLRIAVGIVVILLGLFFQSSWGVLGVVFITTGLIKWCPIYVPLKITTILPKRKTI